MKTGIVFREWSVVSLESAKEAVCILLQALSHDLRLTTH